MIYKFHNYGLSTTTFIMLCDIFAFIFYMIVWNFVMNIFVHAVYPYMDENHIGAEINKFHRFLMRYYLSMVIQIITRSFIVPRSDTNFFIYALKAIGIFYMLQFISAYGTDINPLYSSLVIITIIISAVFFMK